MCRLSPFIKNTLECSFEQIGHKCPVCNIPFVAVNQNKDNTDNKSWCDCRCSKCGLKAEVQSCNIKTSTSCAVNSIISNENFDVYHKLAKKPLLIIVCYDINTNGRNFIVNVHDIMYCKSENYTVCKYVQQMSSIKIENHTKMLNSSVSFTLKSRNLSSKFGAVSCKKYISDAFCNIVQDNNTFLNIECETDIDSDNVSCSTLQSEISCITLGSALESPSPSPSESTSTITEIDKPVIIKTPVYIKKPVYVVKPVYVEKLVYIEKSVYPKNHKLWISVAYSCVLKLFK